MSLRLKTIGLAAAVVVLVSVGLSLTHGSPYKLQLLMPAADGTIVGTEVKIAGEPVGKVTAIGVEAGSAKVTVQVDSAHAPLHAGTTARIDWNAVLGRRQVELLPGPTKNPSLASGQLVRSNIERVELDDILATLDGPTRQKVQGLVSDLDQALNGNEQDLNQTLTQAGPFVQALGQVLQGVGQDEPAIKSLVTNLHQITQTLSDRNAGTASTVSNLTALVQQTAQQEQNLAAALDQVPGTLTTGTTFFNHVPGAVDQAAPLLDQLKPTAARLPGLAKRLNPVLTQLRPTVADLRPTLASAQSLLNETPGLLDTGTGTVPQLDSALSTLQPAVSFLRPYTPEVIGFLTNWTSLFSAKNAAGHFGRAMIPVSASMLDDSTSIVPPGMTQWQAPAPGQLAGQPWTDANGDSAK